MITTVPPKRNKPPQHTHDQSMTTKDLGPPKMQPVTAQQCASKPGSALSGSTEQDESMHSKLATKPSSETSGGEAVEATGSQAAYLATSSAPIVRSRLARTASGNEHVEESKSGAQENGVLLPGMIASERAPSFDKPGAHSFRIPLAGNFLPGRTASTDEQITDEESDDEAQETSMLTIAGHGNKQRTNHPRPILITEQRRLERSLRPKAVIELQRVHFRLPKMKRSLRILQPLESSAAAVQYWRRGMLLPIAWELWAFPFRLAFCDIERGQSMIVYSVDVFCDIWFGLAMIGDDLLVKMAAHAHLCCQLYPLLYSRLNVCVRAVSFFVRIPAGTYPGQTENARSFLAIARLVARHSIPRELVQILVYHVASQALLLIKTVESSAPVTQGHWIWCASAVPRVVFRTLRAAE